MLVLKHSTRFVFPCHHGELGMPGFHPSGDQEAEAMEEEQAGDKRDETGSPPPPHLGVYFWQKCKSLCEKGTKPHKKSLFQQLCFQRFKKNSLVVP